MADAGDEDTSAVPYDYAMPTPGRTLTNLIGTLRSAIAPGTSVTLTVLKNGIPTVLTTTLAGPQAGGTVFPESFGSVAYAPGDRFDLQVTPVDTVGTLLSASIGVAPP